jgi:hypothetical protein
MCPQRNLDEGDIIIHTDLICFEEWGQLTLHPDRVSSKKVFGITSTSRSCKESTSKFGTGYSNISENGKHISEYHRLSKFICYASGRQNHWFQVYKYWTLLYRLTYHPVFIRSADSETANLIFLGRRRMSGSSLGMKWMVRQATTGKSAGFSWSAAIQG